MVKLNADEVRAAILAWPSLYQTEAGTFFRGETVSGTPKRLREAGWRNVSRLDRRDFEKMGLKIVTARYVGGTSPKRYCDVIVAAIGRVTLGKPELSREESCR